MVKQKRSYPKSCSRSHWYNILSGQRHITHKMAQKLESELDIPWRRLVGLKGGVVKELFESREAQ